MNNAIVLKGIREEYGFTQKEFSIYLGLDIRTIQNWDYRGSSETVYKLLNRLYWSDRAQLGENFDNDKMFKEYMRKELERIMSLYN